MYRITVKGEAKTAYPNLAELDGIDCQDNFSDYFDNDDTYSDVVSSGYMDFRYENSKLMTYTTYDSERELTFDELRDLKEYTIGQWSDGIGEGFEQESCYEASTPYQQFTEEELEDIKSGKYDDDTDLIIEVFISPWFNGQNVVISQEKL